MQQHELIFKHICFKYRGNEDSLFHNLDVSIKTGELVGILGASGSGKTTLTEILLGRLKSTCLQFGIEEDGKMVSKNSIGWSYVPQKNLLRGYLTVKEIFDIYATGYLNKLSKVEKNTRVSSIIKELGLEPFTNRKVSDLSGGQQRRVSIGIELLSDSRYFILDEPSSGLDALSDRNLLSTLKILAKTANKAIIVITHNTENLAILDKIIFLSNGLPKFVGNFEELLTELKTSDQYTIRKYLDLSLAEIYQELTHSSKIYKI